MINACLAWFTLDQIMESGGKEPISRLVMMVTQRRRLTSIATNFFTRSHTVVYERNEKKKTGFSYCGEQWSSSGWLSLFRTVATPAFHVLLFSPSTSIQTVISWFAIFKSYQPLNLWFSIFPIRYLQTLYCTSVEKLLQVSSLIDWLIDWGLNDWLIDWIIHWLIDWLIDWLDNPLIDWLINWLIG